MQNKTISTPTDQAWVYDIGTNEVFGPLPWAEAERLLKWIKKIAKSKLVKLDHFGITDIDD